MKVISLVMCGVFLVSSMAYAAPSKEAQKAKAFCVASADDLADANQSLISIIAVMSDKELVEFCSRKEAALLMRKALISNQTFVNRFRLWKSCGMF